MKRILITDDSPNWVRYHEAAVRTLLGDKAVIDTAESAKEGVEKLMLSIDEPYDVILTDMQMESDFLPLFAGEWFIKQIQYMKEYKNTKIIIISAASNIRAIAEKNGVDYIPKYNCREEGAYDRIGEL